MPIIAFKRKMALTNPKNPILSNKHHKPRQSQFPTPSLKINKFPQNFEQPHQEQHEELIMKQSELWTKFLTYKTL